MDNARVAEYIALLKDDDRHVRVSAANALAAIGDPAIPALIGALKDQHTQVRIGAVIALGTIGNVSFVPMVIAKLKDTEGRVRSAAAEALGKIRDPSAIPALVEALHDKETDVRMSAASALGEMQNDSGVPILIEALKDESGEVRSRAVIALTMIPDVSAIPALIEALKDQYAEIRSCAAGAWGRIGDPHTLPRMILANSLLSAQHRIQLLEKLRGARYYHEGRTSRYAFPDTRTLCQTILGEADTNARTGAQTVLNWLNGDRDLLVASQRDIELETKALLRASQGAASEMRPESLLIAVDEPENNGDPLSKPPTLWQRLRGNPKKRAT